MKIEFKPVEAVGKYEDGQTEPRFFIGIYVDDEWSGNVNFVDLPAQRVCRVSHPGMGWQTASELEVKNACSVLKKHLENGDIK